MMNKLIALLALVLVGCTAQGFTAPLYFGDDALCAQTPHPFRCGGGIDENGPLFTDCCDDHNGTNRTSYCVPGAEKAIEQSQHDGMFYYVDHIACIDIATGEVRT